MTSLSLSRRETHLLYGVFEITQDGGLSTADFFADTRLLAC